jgi:hypothetical protein
MKLTCYLLSACIFLAGLAGCSYESRETTMHKPGVYKGVKDPLLAKEQEREQQQKLIDRFKLVQTDRW